MKTALEPRTLTCTYIDTCYPDYLQDHHNRENELLILATPTICRATVCDDFWISAISSDKIPQEISDSEIKSAIFSMVDSLNTSEIDYREDSEVYLYAYLSW